MNVVITGTSRGIGLELVTQALARGDRVLAVARDPERSPGLMKLKSAHGNLSLAAADVSLEKAGEEIASAVSAWPCVDVLINNAGVYEGDDTQEDFLESFRVNSIAPLFVARALFPQLRKAKQPKSIQITSLMGSIGDNGSGGSYSYRASKAALNMITKCLSVDERWLISAVIHPGWVQTDMGGSGAPTPVVESASGIWRVVMGLKPGDSGSFLDYGGDRLPW